MPDQRMHRGPHPDDHKLFSPEQVPSLRAATHDLSWLLERRYAPDSALKLVGDRYQLKARQRAAVLRAACPDTQASSRHARQVSPDQLRGQTLCIDGFNVITSLEVALSGGVLLICRDGVIRDVAGVHGSYRSVEETEPAIMLLARTTQTWGVASCEIYLDQPVSNSGRLRAHILQLAAAHDLPLQAFVVRDPDRTLMASQHIVASADSQILNAEVRWLNLARECITRALPRANVVDLS
jgi:hypothetical protein